MHFYDGMSVSAMLMNNPDKIKQIMNEECAVIMSGYIRGEVEFNKTGKEFALVLDPFVPYDLITTIKFHGSFSESDTKYDRNLLKFYGTYKLRMHCFGRITSYSQKEKVINLDIIRWYQNLNRLDARHLDEMCVLHQAKDTVDQVFMKMGKQSAERTHEEKEKVALDKASLFLYKKEQERYEKLLVKYIKESKLMENFKKEKNVETGAPILYSEKVSRLRRNMRLPENEKIFFTLFESGALKGVAFTSTGISFLGNEKGFFGKTDIYNKDWEEIALDWFTQREKYTPFCLVKHGQMSFYGNKPESLRFNICIDSSPVILNSFVNIFCRALYGYNENDYDISLYHIDEEF